MGIRETETIEFPECRDGAGSLDRSGARVVGGSMVGFGDRSALVLARQFSEDRGLLRTRSRASL
jgi:hypothetical protein